MNDFTLFVSVGVLLILLVLLIFQWRRIKFLRVQAETDPFTNLLNYQGICKSIQKIIKNNSPFCLAVIDIDNFRNYNKQSYKLGDDVLKEFCSKLQDFLPDQSHLGRFRMGDEFVLVFENASFEKTQEIIAAIKLRFTTYRFKCLSKFSSTHVTFSEGIAQYTTETVNPENLFSIAETGLRLQKQAQ